MGSAAATIRLVTQQQRDEIAARVRAEMDRQGLTNSRLARLADLSEKTISRLINARKDPHYDTLERVARALHVPEEHLRPALPAPLGLGASVDGSQLDRIEQGVKKILDLLTVDVPGTAASQQAARDVDAEVARLEEAAGSRRKPTPGRRASARAAGQRKPA